MQTSKLRGNFLLLTFSRQICILNLSESCAPKRLSDVFFRQIAKAQQVK